MKDEGATTGLWPPGEGPMASRVRDFDWSATSLGPVSAWSAELKSSVSFVLENRFPAALVWGPGLVTIYNDAFRPILGDKPESLGRSFADIWNEAWDQIGPLVQHAYAGESTFIEDYPLTVERGRGPELAYFTFSYSPIRTADGEVAGMIDTVVETTSHVRGQQALKRSEEQFRAFVTASSDVVYRVSADWSEMRRLDRHGSLLEHQASDPGWMKRYIPSEDWPEIRAAIASAIASRSAIGLEHRAYRADGTIGWTLSRAVPILDADGNIVEWLGTATDVSQRRHAESRSRLLAAMVDSSDDAIIAKTLDGIITSWNAGAQRMFGYSAEEIIGRPVTVLMPDDRKHEEPGILDRIRCGEGIEHFETIRRRKDGSDFPISLTISPIRGEQGAIVGASKIGRDITERRRAEALVALLAREAEHRTKNAFATVTATVRLTEADDADELKLLIEGRIRALSDVHSLFVKARWSGADVSAIVAQEMEPYQRQAGRSIVLEGVELLVNPASAQTLAVAIHELATNAAKYGALSVSKGGIRVEWSAIAADRFRLRWSESNGPPVAQPSKSGFGTGILEQMTVAQDGTIAFDWDPKGLSCTLILPR